LQQRDAKRSEISLIDSHYAGLQLVAVTTSVDNELALYMGIRRRDVQADSDRGDTGNGCDLLLDLFDIRGARFTRLKTAPLGRVVEVQRDADLHDIGGIVAEGQPICAVMRTLQRCFRGVADSVFGARRNLASEEVRFASHIRACSSQLRATCHSPLTTDYRSLSHA
jgi:hypothetical protein